MFEAKRGSDLFKLRATLSICFYIIPAAHSRAKLFFVLKNILVGEKYLSCALACINPSEVDTCWPRLEMVIFVSCVWRPRARPGHSSSFVMSTDFDHLIIWTGRCLAVQSSLTTTGDSAAKICHHNRHCPSKERRKGTSTSNLKTITVVTCAMQNQKLWEVAMKICSLCFMYLQIEMIMMVGVTQRSIYQPEIMIMMN